MQHQQQDAITFHQLRGYRPSFRASLPFGQDEDSVMPWKVKVWERQSVWSDSDQIRVFLTGFWQDHNATMVHSIWVLVIRLKWPWGGKPLMTMPPSVLASITNSSRSCNSHTNRKTLHRKINTFPDDLLSAATDLVLRLLSSLSPSLSSDSLCGFWLAAFFWLELVTVWKQKITVQPTVGWQPRDEMANEQYLINKLNSISYHFYMLSVYVKNCISP